MRRKLIVLAATTAALLASAGAFAWGDTEVIEIGTRDVPYKITDGSRTETGVVKYHAFLTRVINEAGHASTLTHPFDDRRCSWDIQAHLEREVCFTTIMGGQSCNNSMKIELPFSVHGSNGNPSGIFDHRPCTDAIGDINNNTQSMKAAADLTAESDKDLNGALASTMRGRGVTVTYQPH